MTSQSPNFEQISLLEFQKEMFDDIFNSDCLLIASKGLGLHSLLLNVIEAYNCGKNLVLVIGSSQELNEFIVSHFRRKKCARMPRIVNSDCGANERSKLYESGGTLLITSRILVVDMLLNRIPIDEITGIIVCKADSIVDSYQEAFILRLYRMNNKTGFIKGLSQNPIGFTQGFAKLDRVMRHLFVRDLFLWPRFHASISASFDARTKPEVIEIRLQLTQEMKTIQFALMDLISMCLKEMVSSNVALLSDVDGMTAENAISPGFNRMIRRRFDPVWHQLSSKTKRFVSDINLLRELLFLLTNEDCVSFYATLSAIRQNVKLGMDISDWLFWDPTEQLFRAAKERLFNVEMNTEKAALEVNQKWLSFVEVINEIKAEVNYETMKDDVNVVVIVEEERTIKKLQEVLDKGVDCLLNEIYERNQKTIAETPNDLRKNEGAKKSSKLDDSITLTQIVRNFDYKEELFKKQGSFNIHYHCLYDGPLKLEQTLREFKPWFFVLYDPLMETVRQLEVYQALKCSPEKSKVYFFLYDKSAEEQKYLTSLRKEKTAFEQLIKDKASMVIPIERDGKNEHHPDLIRGKPDEPSTSTRQAGGQLTRNEIIQQRIIVDMREFRSMLPSIVHKRGFDVLPVTIEIGDYILTPDTCVERKSVSDLIGSLSNGRLYNQCQTMTRHYKRSIILIEFDQNKSFSFKGKYWGLGRRLEPGEHNVVSKLILLTMHFPQVRLIWSPSVLFTAEVFECLKQNKEQPDLKSVAEVTEKQLPAAYSTDKYDIATKDFLLCLPGVNLYNVYAIMNKVTCIADLCKASKDELTSILSSTQNAETLYECLHQNLVSCCVTEQLKVQKEIKSSKRFTKKAKK